MPSGRRDVKSIRTSGGRTVLTLCNRDVVEEAGRFSSASCRCALKHLMSSSRPVSQRLSYVKAR